MAASMDTRSPSLDAAGLAFLRRASGLAEKGWGRVHPNPMVGCVLVKDEVVVGEGFHAEFGGPHAEVEALRAAGARAAGSTAYVSLEPCDHQGKTPPCTRALIEAGVARVVFGAADPGAGSGGAATLAGAGLEVVGPVHSAAEARRENPAYFHADPERPWTLLKLAVSADGRIAARPGVRTAITGAESLEEAHRLRAGVDGILVGTGTARVDAPLLTVRGSLEPRRPPARILLDARRTLGPDLRTLHEGASPVWLVTGPVPPDGWRRTMEGTGARVLEVPLDDEGRILPAPLLARLRAQGIGSLLCEGGGRLAASLLRAEAVDRLVLVRAPDELGDDGVPAFPGLADGPWGWDPEHTAPPPGVPGGWIAAGPPVRRGRDVWRTWDREA